MAQENAANMQAVREAMLQAQAQQAGLGQEDENVVPIDYTSPMGKNYKGKVVFKRPSMMDYMKIGSKKAQYLGAGGSVDIDLVDATVKYSAQAMATLSYVLVMAPEWLVKNGRIDIEAVDDPDLMFHLYDQYLKWDASFRKELPDEQEGDSPASE